MKTPQDNSRELAAALGVPELWLKREDLHHFGSHKGRSIPHMIDHYWHKENIFNFVISSSGNAALAGALAVQHHNENNPDKPISLTIFVGEKIDGKKLSKLETIRDTHITIQQVSNPKQQAFQMEKSSSTGSLQVGTTKFLRQSTDDLALQGYYELAKELNSIPNLQAIFIPTSSGTTAQALGEAFKSLNQKPQIHIVQTEACHPIAAEFNSTAAAISPPIRGGGGGIASAIVDRIAHRKSPVIETIKNSHGSGWIVGDDEIRASIELVKKMTDISISPNSALSIAGLQKATKNGWKWDGAVVCLVTGA